MPPLNSDQGVTAYFVTSLMKVDRSHKMSEF